MSDIDIPLVETQNGKIMGSVRDNIHIWLGIPYAAPPTGDLRWRAPHPVVSWTGIRETTMYPRASWQDTEHCKSLGGNSVAFSEDCLYLNIWSPAIIQGSLPVMIWLHGGSYTTGSGSLPLYDGGALAKRGVVVVTVNYRLGHLGFFAHPALENEEKESINNFALLDQIAALNWVKENITAFGGDKHNITLFGGSAGARSVLSLMASPRSKGLFHKAIIQSGYMLPDIPREKALENGIAVAKHFGLHYATAEQLRAIPAQEFWPLRPPLKTSPIPISGDSVLPLPMSDIFRTGKQHPMPVLIGSNSDEASVMSSFGIDPAHAIGQLRKSCLSGLGLLRLLYPYVKGDGDLGRQVFRDIAFTTSGYTVMKAQQHVGEPCWRYFFDYLAEEEHGISINGASHGSEVPYVFNTLSMVEPKRSYITQNDLIFSTHVADYWVNFSSYGSRDNDVLHGPVRWPACIQGRDYLLRIGLNKQAGFKVENRFMLMRMMLFKQVMKRYVRLD
ncbi:carboxylesterase/lipase family protein [Salmonella enterica subsp. enterica serovar Typhimurium]|nr:carboxylesterase/lipase family protein [Salmonella enterica subsp. enterica serovar Typhimurium]